MKEIKSKRYLRKEAIWSEMPIGDPGLPGQLSERDIPGGPDPDDSYGQQGETEVGPYIIYYTYDYDYNDNYANNIKVIRAKRWEGNQYGPDLTNPDLLYRLGEMYDDTLRADIEEMEADNKMEREPGYNPHEIDRYEDY